MLVQNCHDLLQSKDWQIESILSNEDIIFYMDHPKIDGKVFKIVVSLQCSLFLFRIILE